MSAPAWETVEWLDYGRVIDVGGHPMPETFRARVSWDGEPLALVLEVVHDKERGWLMPSVVLSSGTGTVAGADTWRLADTERLLTMLLARVEMAFATSKPVRRRKSVDYVRVAEVYRGASKAPAKTVAKVLGVSAATATRWIQEARRVRPDLFDLLD